MAEATTTFKCRVCGSHTKMDGTSLCDRCWELERRITMDTNLSVKILSEIIRARVAMSGTEETPLDDLAYLEEQSGIQDHLRDYNMESEAWARLRIFITAVNHNGEPSERLQDKA